MEEIRIYRLLSDLLIQDIAYIICEFCFCSNGKLHTDDGYLCPYSYYEDENGEAYTDNELDERNRNFFDTGAFVTDEELYG